LLTAHSFGLGMLSFDVSARRNHTLRTAGHAGPRVRVVADLFWSTGIGRGAATAGYQHRPWRRVASQATSFR